METNTPKAESQASAPTEHGDTAVHEKPRQGWSLPVLMPELHLRHVPLPRLGVGHVPVPRVYMPASEEIRRRLPDRDASRWLWYGGLAGLAAFGVIEWPVAGVVAVGTYLAGHHVEHVIEQLAHEEPSAAET
jgi:hypothetical protein